MNNMLCRTQTKAQDQLHVMLNNVSLVAEYFMQNEGHGCFEKQLLSQVKSYIQHSTYVYEIPYMYRH